MASQSLYRKWRSQTFDELVGQEHVVQTLRNAIVEERVAHAYLFTGPRGVGKTTMARLLAKAVNCTDPDPSRRPCGVCASCVAIAEGRAVDVIEMDAASHTSVEDAREIIERVQFRPSEGSHKVYVIDECFRYDEPVTLADGSKVPIGKLVDERWQADVLSYNEQTRQIEPKPMVRHMRKQPTLPMVRVTLNRNRAIVCTLNHKFYTPQGMVRAGELVSGQFVYANFERITRHQLEVVAGAAVGDGNLSVSGEGVRGRLRINQGVRQKAYLDYKVRLLGDLAQTAPVHYLAERSFSKTGIYRFATTSRPQIAQLHALLYDESSRKRITASYLEHMTPLGIALWYLDDGSLVTAKHPYTRRDGSVTSYPATRSTLSTYGFSAAETRLICEWLCAKWELEARWSNTAKGTVIWFTLAGTARLHALIGEFVPPEMEYKLLPPYRGRFAPPIDDLTVDGLAVSRVKKVERVPSTEFVYNIEVADNHNYFVRDMLVANCHQLSTAAFNALLKTLEEPPDHAIFVLATTEVHKVPATVLSRCQRFTFTRHGVASTSEHRRRIAEAEAMQLEEGVPEAIARAATGSMRDALSVLEQLASYASGPITLEQVHSLLGMTSAAEVLALIDALLDGDTGAALRAVNGVADQGADLRQFTRDLVERLRSLLLLIASGDSALADIGDDERRVMEGWAGRANLAGLLHWVQTFSGLDHQLRTTPYGHLPLELAVVEALVGQPQGQQQGTGYRVQGTGQQPQRAPATAQPAARQAAPLPPLVPRPTAGQRQTSTPPVAPAVKVSQPAPELSTPEPTPVAEEVVASVAEAAASSVVEEPGPQHVELGEPAGFEAQAAAAVLETEGHAGAYGPRSPEEAAAANADFSVLEQVEGLWEEIKRDVRPRSPAVQALLHGARPIDVEGSTLVLLAASSFHKDNLEKAQNRKYVEEVVRKHVASLVAIRCTIEAKDEVRDLRGQIREARKDELVRAAMNIFEAHIVDIEPEE